MTGEKSLRGRCFALFLCHCEPRFFRLAKQSRSSGRSLQARFSVCEAISMTRLLRAFGPRNDRGKSLRGRSIVSEAVSTVGLLRAFGPRKDWWGVTASLVLRPPFVTASLVCSPPICHCEVVAPSPKQSQRFLAASRLGRTEEETARKDR
jgi:hypothetical protein